MTRHEAHLVVRTHGWNVDLKWSLWSACMGHWEEYAPEVLKVLKGLKVGQSVEVCSSPRKEIRGGNVTISRTGKTVWTGSGAFATEWDGVSELADTLGLFPGSFKTNECRCGKTLKTTTGYVESCTDKCRKKYEDADNEVIDSLRECVPHTMFMCEPGCEREFEVKARSLGKLLAAIDEEEAKLLDEDRKAWEMIEGLYSKRKKKGK